MTLVPPVKTRIQLLQDWIRRVLTYTSLVSYFGPNSLLLAWGKATATLVESAHQHYLSLQRRVLLSAATGDWLSAVARERGAERQTQLSGGVFVVFQPVQANVTLINIGAVPGFDDITVDDGADFLALDEIRIRNGTGATTETAIIAAKPSANVLRVATLVNAYTPATDDVDVLFRIGVPAGTLVRGAGRATFATTTALTTSDSNAVLDGESTSLALADKAWCEATVRGADGAVDAGTITQMVTPIRGIRAVINPAPSTGAAAEESDGDVRYRAAHWPSMLSQETEAGLQELARAANSSCLRCAHVDSDTVGQMDIRVLHRGGAFSADELAEIGTYIGDRIRSGLDVVAANVTLTAVNVQASVTLDPGSTLEDAWRAAASRLSDFLDASTWTFGEDVSAADLLVLVRQTDGIASVDASSFLPAADVTVGATSLPTLAYLAMRDTDTGDTVLASLVQSW